MKQSLRRTAQSKKGGLCCLENWWIFLIFAATCVLCALISAKTSRKYMNYYENGGNNAPEVKEPSPKEIWKKEGCSRSFENAEFELPEEDFFENEKTELPETEEELFSGLSEEEKEAVITEAGLEKTEDKDER